MDLMLYFECFLVLVSLCYFVICLAVLASGYATAPFQVYLQHRNASLGIKLKLIRAL